jgi:hypothetical protein
MKTFKIIAISAMLAALAPSLYSQTIRDFFNNAADVIWLGIDFSHVRLVGEFTQFKDAGPIDPAEIRDRYFPAWNSLILNESSKYDVKGMFMLNQMKTDVDMIQKLNAETQAQNLKAYEAPQFSCDDMKKYVKSYNLTGKQGLGIAFVAEALNKTTDIGSFYILVLNLSSKEILLCEKMTGKTSGIGIRNFWAGSIYNIIKDVKKTEYLKWKAEYVK